MAPVPFTFPLGTVARALVDAACNGSIMAADMLAQVRGALRAHGLHFRMHPVWLHVTTCPPHSDTIRRLAEAVGLADIARAVHKAGYADAREFHEEIDGWVAWYSVPRRVLSLQAVVGSARAASLFGDGVDVPVESESDIGDSSENDCAIECGRGITATAKVADAACTVKADVVTAGLLANQRLSGIPKGAGSRLGQGCFVSSP